MPERLKDALDQALAEGTFVDSDGCTAMALDPPQEAAIVSLPKSQLLYVSFGLPRPGLPDRPAERWIPTVHLQPATLNGWAYLSAKRLYVEPSVPIYAALETLFGRGKPWDVETATSGEQDMHSKKMQSVEKVEIEALIEIDNAGIGSASRTQFILFRGTWLPFRKISKLFASRAEQPKNDNNFPDISII